MKRGRQEATPLVSVIMPVYNAGEFLKQAIDSIIQQSYQNFELIIVNDASTDNSWQTIQAYKKRYPKIIKSINILRNLNRGGDRCANEGLKLARGTYVARMDADDVAHPERLAKQVVFLEENKNIFLVGTEAYVIDKEGTILGEKHEPETNKDIYDSYFTFHPIIHPSAMFRRKVDGKPFAYDIKYSANNDYYTFFKLLCQKKYQYANLQEKLLYYRIHGANDTFNHIRRKFINTFKIRMEMVLKYGYSPSIKQVATTIAQLAITVILPEKAIKTLYLLTKGIVKPESTLKRFSLKASA